MPNLLSAERVETCPHPIARNGAARGRWRVLGLVVLWAGLTLPSGAGVGLGQPPTITTQPQSVSAPAGHEVVLFARAYGTGATTFQWLRGGVPLAGAGEPVLRFAPLATGHAGDYQVVVSNRHGRSTSAVARVTVPGDAGWSPAGVWSCNAVGYVNVALVPGFTLVVNPLQVDDESVGQVAR